MTSLVEQTPLVILAGGLATRLRGLANSTPKYLQPIDEGTVFADLHLRWARKQGFQRVILCVGHLGELIQAHCGSGAQYGLQLDYVFDGVHPVGTGGAVQATLQFPFEMVAVTYGDTLLSVPAPEFLQKFHESGLGGAMTVYRNQVAGHVCNADLNGIFVSYNKMAPDAKWAYIDYGFLALKRQVIAAFKQHPPFDLAEPLARLAAEQQLYGLEVSERFWEIGTPEALAEFKATYRRDLAR